jgi:hypothetical protein
MAKQAKTSFGTKCAILAEIWSSYREDADFEDFVSFNDLGLPLAYLTHKGIVKATTSEAKEVIEESFVLLLAHFEIEDLGYQTLQELLDEL